MRVKFNLIQGFVSMKGGPPTFFSLLCIPAAYFTPGPSLTDEPAVLQIWKKGVDSIFIDINNVTVSYGISNVNGENII